MNRFKPRHRNKFHHRYEMADPKSRWRLSTCAILNESACSPETSKSSRHPFEAAKIFELLRAQTVQQVCFTSRSHLKNCMRLSWMTLQIWCSRLSILILLERRPLEGKQCLLAAHQLAQRQEMGTRERRNRKTLFLPRKRPRLDSACSGSSRWWLGLVQPQPWLGKQLPLAKNILSKDIMASASKLQRKRTLLMTKHLQRVSNRIARMMRHPLMILKPALILTLMKAHTLALTHRMTIDAVQPLNETVGWWWRWPANQELSSTN